MMAQAYVSVQRIEDFLKEDEVPDWVSSLKRPTPAADAPVDTRIGFDNADFKWNTGMTAEDTKKAAQETAAKKTNGNGVPAEEEEEEILPFELNDLDITFPAGKLSVIAGPTGSGKSAMLLALLGEMDCVKGTVFLPKENTQIDKLSGLRNAVAYCSQSPWLQHKSIKENILFGEEFDETRYHMTLEACALVPDLEVLDDGDETEIGVRGVSLSGGQKARIALARAVYSRTAHVLLDDILAAVDSHTAKDLVEGCLKGPLLQGRTVLLVSHHVELLLPVTDYLVRILDGRIENAGTPSELREKGLLNGFLTSEETDNEKQAADNDEQIAAETRVLEEQDHKETTKEKLDKKSRPGRKLVKDEERASGSVTWATYKTYLVASTWTVWIFTVVLLTASQGTTLGERWWLKIWGEAYQYSLQAMSTFTTSTMGHVDGSFSTHSIHFANQHQQHLFAAASTNQTMTVEKIGLPKMPSANVHPGFYVLGLFIIDLTGFLIAMISSLNSAWGSYKAAVSIHDNMLSSVMRSTVRFYDTTPSGRIINRFSKDVETIDNSLSSNLKQVLANVGVLFGAIFLVAVILPGFLIPAAFIAYAFYYLTIRYLSASRSMRRIESTKRSPIFSGFNEVLDGISIVRAFGAERMFTKRLFDQVDESQAAFYYLWMCNRWLLYRFDFLGGFAVFLTTILALSGAVSPGSAGVAILSSQSLVMGVYWISRNWGQLEQDFNSVERAKEYLDLPQEPAAIIPNSRPPAYWPSDSNKENFLRVENLSIRYAPELPDVLHDLTFTIKAKERIGVIGRTGR
jgi:ABC-type multidrug transport system fused ATPase/permease subunit